MEELKDRIFNKIIQEVVKVDFEKIEVVADYGKNIYFVDISVEVEVLA